MEEIIRMILEESDQAEELIEELKKKYEPVLSLILKELFEVYKKYADNTEYFRTVAKVKMNQFDAYIEVGFDEDQAMTLIVNDTKMLKENMSRIGKK